MTEVHYETEFKLDNKTLYSDWITRVISSEGITEGEINFIFCDDSYLLEVNQRFLDHDYYTDIITFDYSDAQSISGDIFISVERVADNAKKYGIEFEMELRRVMAHGVLHLMRYNDHTEDEKAVMRIKEDEKMKLFHVEQ